MSLPYCQRHNVSWAAGKECPDCTADALKARVKELNEKLAFADDSARECHRVYHQDVDKLKEENARLSDRVKELEAEIEWRDRSLELWQKDALVFELRIKGKKDENSLLRKVVDAVRNFYPDKLTADWRWREVDHALCELDKYSSQSDKGDVSK